MFNLYNNRRPLSPKSKRGSPARKISVKNNTTTVCFSSARDEVHEVERWSKYDDETTTDTNKTQIWYSHSEEEEFKDRDYIMALLFQQGMDPHEVEFKTAGEESTRGLESLFVQRHQDSSPPRSPMSIAESRRRTAITAVIATQRLFKSLKRDGTSVIARSYAACCLEDKEDARQLAIHDAQFVTDHIRGTELKSITETLSQHRQRRRSDRPALLGRCGHIQVFPPQA